MALAVGLVLLLCGCGGGSGRPRSAPTSSAPPPGDSDALVLQVATTGGLAGPQWWRTQLPRISVYADGRAISEGPVPAIYPGPALPNVLVQHLDAAALHDLLDAALAAGVADPGDLGHPAIADALTTRFTVTTASGTFVREVYALGEADPTVAQAGVTDAQRAARTKLRDLEQRLDRLAWGPLPTEQYRASAVAVLAHPWVDPQDRIEHPAKAWTGPDQPGTPMRGRPATGCVVATGDQARAVLDAAAQANELTPWVGDDGARWVVSFRPLLPHETGCADLDA